MLHEKYGENQPPNIWLNFLKLIHKKKIGEYVYRTDFVNKKHRRKNHSVDTYRLLLNKIGVLETVKPGVYIKRKNVKTKWSLSEIREIAYGTTWKSWFYKIE